MADHSVRFTPDAEADLDSIGDLIADGRRDIETLLAARLLGRSPPT